MFPVKSQIFTEIYVEKIAKLCFDKFESLPKTGKPSNNEWTVLSAVILHNNKTGKSQVIALGCGTKCIGKSKLCPQGLILNDSHAEVMARRGLIRYMYHQINEASTDNQSIFIWVPGKQKFQLKDELSLHFLSTQTPCGDACIIDTEEAEDYTKESCFKRSRLEQVQVEEINAGSIVTTIYTGAKLIDSRHCDAMEQVAGAVRTKPGRGERTLSMSCSDKLAKWQIMGVQGALLDVLLTNQIYFDTLNFWGEMKNIASLERAVWKRFENNEFDDIKYKLVTPKIRIFNKPVFLHSQDSTKTPTPNGIVWCDIPNCLRPYEISVNGKRQGVTTKKVRTPESALKISKYFLLQEFINVIKLKPELIPQSKNLESKTYLDFKLLAKDYQMALTKAKIYYFKKWSQKPNNMLKFCVKDDGK